MVRLCYELEDESHNSIILVMNDGPLFDRLERHHIFLSNVIMSYLCRLCKVDLRDPFGRFNVIRL